MHSALLALAEADVSLSSHYLPTAMSSAERSCASVTVVGMSTLGSSHRGRCPRVYRKL